MLTVIVLGATLGLGLVAIVAGLIPTPPAPPRPKANGVRLAVSRRARLMLLAGLGGGVLAWQITGWVLALVVVPVAALGLPALLSGSDVQSQIAKLEAMAEWTRSLAGVLTVGIGLEQALAISLRSAPAPIEPEVRRLTSRLRARWRTEDALRAFADELNDATGDLIAMNLVLAARKRGTGLASVLEALAESVEEDVRARRQIEADRAKPRATARWVTAISVTVFALLSLTSSYNTSYRSSIGQVVLVVLLSAYVATLVWLKKMAAGKPWPRLLTPDGARP
ncbi:Flp pilus assembly protein TadB [Georgenia muralis]|uniref:Flp pilus assembly protein TadB n=2 Tax=Georgenia muralis TaxID=154117 RepID=A0A3N4Z965_9MICO|nr:Flp pilus assembly protein TadB [Georgenia muralis]